MALPTWSALDRKQHPTTFDVTNFDVETPTVALAPTTAVHRSTTVVLATTTDAKDHPQMTHVARKCP